MNMFGRAFVGFVTLTVALALMGYVALWAIGVYAGGSNWAAIITVLLAMIAEIAVYSTTLHDPIYKWIKGEDLSDKAVRDITLAYKSHVAEELKKHRVEDHQGGYGRKG